MLKRKCIYQYNNESNEEFEKRINELLKKEDTSFKEDDKLQFDMMCNNDNKIFIMMACKSKENKSNNIGF